MILFPIFTHKTEKKLQPFSYSVSAAIAHERERKSEEEGVCHTYVRKYKTRSAQRSCFTHSQARKVFFFFASC